MRLRQTPKTISALFGSIQNFMQSLARPIPQSTIDRLLEYCENVDLPEDSDLEKVVKNVKREFRSTKQRLLKAIEQTGSSHSDRKLERLQLVFAQALIKKFGYEGLTPKQRNRLTNAVINNRTANSYVKDCREKFNRNKRRTSLSPI